MTTCASCGQRNPEGFRFCGACGGPLEEDAPAPREVRKTVTVVFCDVTGSTALGERLDPETLRRAMGRWFEAARTAVERHGGTVEKFVGDAVMAVFGIPTLHEDDALRAVRAAVEMRDSLAALNDDFERDYGLTIEVRTGVNTGEVVAGEGETLATGDAVNVGARLEQAAQTGEILIGDATHRLVRDAIRAEPVEPLAAKGKAEPVAAHRLLEVVAGAEPFARRLDALMVGRENELTQLRQAYERAIRERTAYLFTVLGAAGIGKSRLALEFLSGIEREATVLAGRCLPYGEGITYWPLVEILRRAAHHEARARIVELLSGEEDAELVADPLAALIGEGGSAGAADEIAWATRRLLERLARDRPLVVVFDDLQWAEPTFFDLVEHLADWTRDAPVLLFCIARPDILEARPAWGGGKLNATSLLLEPLTEEESGRLLDALLAAPRFAPALRERILAAAEGNPLFVEQMLAMAGEDADGSMTVPPTIQALLAARLERLTPEERRVIERAAVIGKEFSLSDVAALSDNGSVRPQLMALVRKQLVRSESEDVFRFRHLLIRDAAYEAIPKELRAELHERYAERLEATAGERLPEIEEIVGYHFEQAYRYLVELARLDESSGALAARAAERLGAAGRRALDRGDIPAAVSLLDRAAALLPTGERRSELLLELSVALGEAGDLSRGEAILDEAAAAAGDRLGKSVALRRLNFALLTGESMEDARRKAESLIDELERDGDERLLAEARAQLGRILFWLNEPGHGLVQFELAMLAGERSGNERWRAEAMKWTAFALMWGPDHVDLAAERCQKLLAQARGNRDAESEILAVLGLLEALGGDPDRGREAVAASRAIQAELGRQVMYATMSQIAGILELFAGDAEAAERHLREGYELLDEAGEKGYNSTVAGMLASALAEQGRYEEAEPFADRARELGAPDDATTQLHWRLGKARALAGRGRFDEAIAIAREAIAIKRAQDVDESLAYASAAEVLAEAGDTDEARALLVHAIEGAERKGIVLGLDRMRRRLASLTAAQSPSSSG